MEQIEVFEFDGIFYNIPKDIYEIREHYIDRVNFIIKQIKLNKIVNFNTLIRESRIWSNEKKLHCSYNL